MKTVKLDILSVNSIDAAIEALKKKKQDIDRGTRAFVEQMHAAGVDEAKQVYRDALVAGRRDVRIKESMNLHRLRDGYTARVRAIGKTVLMIEFGTGIRYQNAYQLRHGYYAGQYGKGHGANPGGWFYKGRPGGNPPPDTRRTSDGRGSWTYGSPANRFMYFSRRALSRRSRYGPIARRAFR